MPWDPISDYDPAWPSQFETAARSLREALGHAATRIDHIGSTSVPGLAAKPIIDLQISVPDLAAIDDYRPAIETCGFAWRPDNPDLTKWYFRELPGRSRTHVHVRQAGSFAEQAALLFRDYLRAYPLAAQEYAAVKRDHAYLLASDRSAYVEAKAPFTWRVLQEAHLWAQQTGWRPGPADF